MMDYYFTFRSITTAQRASELLRRHGLSHTLCRTPQSMAGQGCGYSLRIRQQWSSEAAVLLRRYGIAFQRVYQPGDPPTEIGL